MAKYPKNADEDVEDEEGGEARKLPGAKECKDAINKLQKLDEAKANLGADIRGVFDSWANKGFDRDDLKAAYKEYKKNRSSESKQGINHILHHLGQGDLFAHADAAKEAA